jgi:hypothetical protein
MRRSCLVIAALAVAVCGSLTAQTRYNRATDWGERPAGLAWAAVIGAEPGPDGNIYVLHRCYDNSCAGRSEAPFMVFDPSGKLLRSWGQGQFVFPHGFYVHRDGHVWATDGQGRDGKGHQVFEFSADGRLLRTLGKAGVAGDGPDVFNQPTDVVVSPSGEIFVSDGHRETGNNRIVKFSKDGQFIKAWGRKGSGPGEFHEPHHRDGFAGPAVCRRSREQPHRGLRPGRRLSRRVEAVRASERYLHRPSRHHLCRGFRVRHERTHIGQRLPERHPDRQRQNRPGVRVH